MFKTKAMSSSRTVWVNIIGGVIQVGGLLSGVIPVEYAAIFAGVMSGLNLILRRLTKDAVTLTGN